MGLRDRQRTKIVESASGFLAAGETLVFGTEAVRLENYCDEDLDRITGLSAEAGGAA